MLRWAKRICCTVTQPRYDPADSIPSREGISMIRLMLGFVAAVIMTSGASAQSAVERGGYLMNTIMTCANCHSPKGPPAATAGKDCLRRPALNEPPFDVAADLSRRTKETGIGNWTDDQIKTMILTKKYPRHPGSRSCRRRSIRSHAVDLNGIVALSAEPSAGQEQRYPTRSTRSRCRIMSSRAPRRPMRRPISTTS